MKLNSLQWLRSVAIILVVYANSFIHTNEFAKPHQENFHFLSSIGFIGMDLLFIIAGFAISYSSYNLRGVGDGLQFLKTRFLRLNILFYVASLLFWATVLLKNRIADGSVLFNRDAEIQNAIDTLLVVPATDAQFLYNPFLPLTWALAFPWLAYLLYFVTIVSRVRQKIWLMAGFVLVLSALWYVIKPVDLRLTFLFNPILLEFLLGMAIYQLYKRLENIPISLAYILLFAGIAWYLLLVFFNNAYIGFAGNILAGILSLDRFLYWGIPSGLLVTGCVFLEKAGRHSRVWTHPFFKVLGTASYSIFLFHLTVFTLLSILYQQAGFFLPADVNIFVATFIGLAGGILFYKWVERPLMKWIAGQPAPKGSVITRTQTQTT